MDRQITRLPDGGWLVQLLYSPQVGPDARVRRLTVGEISRRAADIRGQEDQDDATLLSMITLSLGGYTSVTEDQIEHLDPEDLGALMEVLNAQVGKIFGRGSPTPSTSH